MLSKKLIRFSIVLYQQRIDHFKACLALALLETVEHYLFLIEPIKKFLKVLHVTSLSFLNLLMNFIIYRLLLIFVLSNLEIQSDCGLLLLFQFGEVIDVFEEEFWFDVGTFVL